MFCRKCGTKLQDDSQFCSKCGESQVVSSISGGAAAAVAPARIPVTENKPAAKDNSSRTTISAIVLLIVLVGGWLAVKNGSNKPIPQPNFQSAQPPQPQLHTVTIGTGALTVNASSFSYFTLMVPPGASNVKVQGHFTAAGGSGNDIEVFLLSQNEYTNWQNGHSTPRFYNSGRVTVSDANATLPNDAGTYYLVFNNKFSLFTPKAVEESFALTFYQ